jgi:hypothetical protein
MTAAPVGVAPAPSDEIHGEVHSAYPEAWGRARRWILALSGLAILGAIALAGIDWHVYLVSGTDTFDNTISAQATVIATALAVIGGLVATWTFFKAEPPPP